MAESATTRLSRLLTMVPWLLKHQGVELATAAAEFGVTTEQLESDLSLLFLCGTPGGMPDDLIEADWEGGRVYLGNAEHIARPLRLSVDEALTLMVGLRTLLSTPGLAEREPVSRALTKLEEATGSVGSVASRVQVAIDDGVRASVLRQARQAVLDRRRVHLAYLVPARDEVTQRDVDPMRVVSLDAHWYLEGWCHLAEDVRLFRLDRVQALEVLGVDGTPPPQARGRDLEAAAFTPRQQHVEVVLEADRDAAWVADYYPVESVRVLSAQPTSEAGGSGEQQVRLEIRMRVSDPAWVRRLVWRLGGHLTVRSPPDLGTAIRAGAQIALAAYPDNAGGPT